MIPAALENKRTEKRMEMREVGGKDRGGGGGGDMKRKGVKDIWRVEGVEGLSGKGIREG